MLKVQWQQWFISIDYSFSIAIAATNYFIAMKQTHGLNILLCGHTLKNKTHYVVILQENNQCQGEADYTTNVSMPLILQCNNCATCITFRFSKKSVGMQWHWLSLLWWVIRLDTRKLLTLDLVSTHIRNFFSN